MADDPENSGGFTKDGSGIYANPGSLPSDGKDFDGWTWKQIEAAIIGGAAIAPGSGGLARAKEIADPQSLYDAANIFNVAQQNMAQVSKIISRQTEALAGENGPWKGDAATQFATMMNKFAALTLSRANQISGGSTGTDGVVNQLYLNSQYLVWAQNTISQIDTFYAQQVNALGHSLGDGRARISDFPEAVTAMTADMAKVGKQLADNYTITISKAIAPDLKDFGGPKPNVGDTKIPPKPGSPPPLSNIPPPTSPPGGGSGAGIGGDGPQLKDFSATPPPDLGALGGGTGSAGGGSPLSTFDGPPPPDFAGAGAGTGNGPGGGVGGGPSLSDFPGATSPEGFGGADSPGGLPGGVPPLLPFPGAGPGPTGSGSGGSLPGGAGKPGGAPGFADFPLGSGPAGLGGGGSKGLGGTGAAGLGGPGSAGLGGGLKGLGGKGIGGLEGLGAAGLGGATAPVNFPGDLNANTGNRAGLGTNTANPGGLGGGFPGGLPHGGGAPGQSGQGAGRPDAAGLIENEAEPWEGSKLPDAFGEPSALLNTPSETPASWAGGDLAGGSASKEAASFGGVGSPTAADPVGLPSVDDASRAVTGGEQDRAAAGVPGGMPFMPHGGAGGQGGQGATGRPDSAGLIEGESEPWEGAAPPEGFGSPNESVTAQPVAPAPWAALPVLAANGTGTRAVAGGGDVPLETSTDHEQLPVDPPAAEPALPESVAHTAGTPAVLLTPVVPSGASRATSTSASDLADDGKSAAPAPMPWATGASPEVSHRVSGGDDETSGLHVVDGEAENNIAGASQLPPAMPSSVGSWGRQPPSAGDATAPLIGMGETSPLSPDKLTTDPDDSAGGTGAHRVAVVHPSQAPEDVSAWDVGASELLSVVLTSSQIRASRDDAAGAQSPITDDPAYQPAPGLVAYQRRKHGEAEVIGDGFGPMCAADDPLPQEDDLDDDVEDVDDDEEVEERTMADLLNQDDSAWGRSGPKPSGVLG